MARGGKEAAECESAFSRLSHIGPLVVAAYLLAAPRVPICPCSTSVLRRWRSGRLLGAALTFAGFAFSIWARLTIAGNWSSDVQLKRNHELIVEGPYSWVRHPIYTGILLVLAGTALAVGEWRGVLAVALAASAFWRKLRLEEAVMRRQFGETYARYAARVPALIPFVG